MLSLFFNMGQIIDFYKFGNGKPELQRNAFNYLAKDLLDKNLTGENKIMELDGMDMESKLGGSFFPGMIYSFKYKSDKKFDIEYSNLFNDIFPILLCSGISAKSFVVNNEIKTNIFLQGYNLNYLTNKERCIFLDFIQTQYKSFYEEQVYIATAMNSCIVNSELTKLIMDNNSFANIIKASTGIKINNYFRLYNLLLIDNARLIEYNLWKYIPLLDVKRTVNGMSINDIRKLLNK